MITYHKWCVCGVCVCVGGWCVCVCVGVGCVCVGGVGGVCVGCGV